MYRPKKAPVFWSIQARTYRGLGIFCRPRLHQQRQMRKTSCIAMAEHTDRRKPLIKICGVVSQQDARLAAEAGADFVGMILWAKARRSVTLEIAAQISETAREYGANPVGVFVDEDFADIVRFCKAAGIASAQLHGKGARASLPDLPSWLEVIYVMHASPDGSIRTKENPQTLPEAPQCRRADWFLLDGLKGGSGETYDWEKLQQPALESGMKGWLLAGGLTPDNVGNALSLAHPTGVDVSSGVTGLDGLMKDPQKVHKFIEEVVRASH